MHRPSAWNRLNDLRAQPDILEDRGDVAGRSELAVTGRRRRVDRRDADQVAQRFDELFPGMREVVRRDRVRGASRCRHRVRVTIALMTIPRTNPPAMIATTMISSSRP